MLFIFDGKDKIETSWNHLLTVSFDMFSSFEERGNKFKEIVNML